MILVSMSGAICVEVTMFKFEYLEGHPAPEHDPVEMFAAIPPDVALDHSHDRVLMGVGAIELAGGELETHDDAVEL